MSVETWKMSVDSGVSLNPVLPFFERIAPRDEVQGVIDTCDSSRFFPDSIYWRKEAVKKFAFAVPCVEAVEAIVKGSPLVEVGAGSGYWARLLRKFGADIVATDAVAEIEHFGFTVGDDVEVMSAVDAVKAYPERNVFVSWPSLRSSWAFKMAMEVKPGRMLFYIGESYKGCTADDDFHLFLDKEFELIEKVAIPQWPGIHDKLFVTRRKG